MKLIKVPAFDPTIDILVPTLSPSIRPSLAYEIPSLFVEESLTLLLGLKTSYNAKDINALFVRSMRQFMNLKYSEHSTLLGLYTQILQLYLQEGNADTFNTQIVLKDPNNPINIKKNIYNTNTGYLNLVTSNEISFVLNWIHMSFYSRCIKQLYDACPEMSELRLDKDFDSLFKSNYSQEDQSSLFGIVPFETESFEESSSELESYLDSDELLVPIIERLDSQVFLLDEINNRLKTKDEIKKESIYAQAFEEQKRKEEEKRKTNPPTKVSYTLQDIARKIIIEKAPNKTYSAEKLGLAWFSPPPIGLGDLYNLKKIPGTEAAFLVDAFIDVHRTETSLLSIHFILRRLLSLWRNNTESALESALFSGEMKPLLKGLKFVSSNLFMLFSSRFLGLEGITVPGERVIDLKETLFKDKNKLLSVVPFLENLLEVIRDACTCIGRLRLSLLYGKSHKSYIGDSFIKAYFSSLYEIRYIETSFETLLSVIEPMSALSLPNDEQKTQSFYRDLSKKLPEHLKGRGLEEKEARKEYYREDFGFKETKSILMNTGNLEPQTVINSTGEKIFETLCNLQKSPNFLIREKK